ncbi:T9SS type A sorting domain-containing protein [Rhodocytophaga aerolata]|uniref:T9SS type A sorting domain-containing protein n=1 Tax=Rhodocytophaga aerolata TaxID=455078 RepID=A0ABT8R4R4_9BACT|nr:T9SS type A sorting domain-containing protein [Rhodocytophaga aerolata]MDO1447063.1 T9SS type A sorting domain-containing protein [Rhodocytophaga aerolata]
MINYWAAVAQSYTFAYETSIPLVVDGDTLNNSWAGGLNAGQFSTMHLNNDAIEDLVVFDRTTNKLTTYIAVPYQNSYRYQHTPTYEQQFPEGLQFWMLLADYNNDGKKDIFTHTNLGIKVYKNISAPSQLQWELVADPLETQGFSGIINLYVSSTDIPAIVDVDNDGDLDILTFDDVGGSVEYHLNRSKENAGNTETLDFQKVNACWGKFRQGSGCQEFYFGIDCGPSTGRTGNVQRVMHSGSSLLLLDLDGDEDKDLLNGHTGCDGLARLVNQGNAATALFTAFDKQFPASTPINFPTFPAVYYEDLDFDGIKDLIAAPNVFDNELDNVDFTRSGWFYKNTGSTETPQFELKQTNFLQATMLDIGENASPALADYDGDGDLDLFIGSRGKWDASQNKFYATIYLYNNVGTAQKPVFELLTDDYLNLSSLQVTDIKPSFHDLNGDRSLDLIFSSTSGRNATLQYMLNQAPRNEVFAFSVNNLQSWPLSFSPTDVPLLYDIDGDKDLDALVGKFNGSLEYYKNTGSNASPAYTLENASLGGLPADPFARYLALTVADLDNDGKPELITGDRKGILKIYADFANQLTKPFTPVTDFVWNNLQKELSSPQLNGMLFPTAADLNGDNLPELIVGTQAGGIIVLANTSDGGSPAPGPDETGTVFPNPTSRYIYLNLPAESDVALYSVVGQQLVTRKSVPANREVALDLHHLPAGVYLLKIVAGEVQTVKRIVLYR